MNKAIKTVFILIVILIGLSACQSSVPIEPVCYYEDEPVTKVHLIITNNGNHSKNNEKEMIAMINDMFELFGLKLTSKKKADMLIGISVYTEAWADDYGPIWNNDEAYTETATGLIITLLDKEENPVWEDSFYFRAEGRGSIYEGQFDTVGSAPYYESFDPVLLQASQALFGDQFLVLLQDAYQHDDSVYGEYLYDLIAKEEMQEPYQPGVFELR